ncbi:hypothetical protein ACFYPZ_19055 [Streptomyces sp. NPDC005506]|uniref:hypothetical protein n=1 Tax=unclassified Streptomyces TaxID=2593676 RepID=UPI0036CC40B4
MSANHKRIYAIQLCFFLSVVIGVASSAVVAALGAPPLAWVSAGAGAFAVSLGIGIKIIALFDFKDDGTGTSPAQNQQGAPTT